MSNQQDSFWDNVAIPHQTEDEEYQFANIVLAGQFFAKKTGDLAVMGQHSEELTNRLKSVNLLLQASEAKLADFRRRIFAKHWSEITKSASLELQNTFVYMKAEALGKLPELLALEAEIAGHKETLQTLQNKLDVIQFRIKTLSTAVEWGKQYVDFEKLIIRVSANHG